MNWALERKSPPLISDVQHRMLAVEKRAFLPAQHWATLSKQQTNDKS